MPIFFQINYFMRLLLKKPSIFICLILVIVLLTACGTNGDHSDIDEDSQKTPVLSTLQSQPDSLPQNQPEQVPEETFIKLETESEEQVPPLEIFTSLQPAVSLEVKIGQMLIVGFRGMSVRDQGVKQIIQDIQQFHLGGVILFDYDIALKSSKRNIKSRRQVKSLIEQLQTSSQIPLFIAIDQEGGKIRRLKEKFGFPRTVSAQYLGTKNNLALTYKYASRMAETLADLGINFNFAPVVDLNINPNNPI